MKRISSRIKKQPGTKMDQGHKTNLLFATYNSTGLASHKQDYIRWLLNERKPHVILLQETWLIPSHISAVLGSLHEDYMYTGVSAMSQATLLQGRPHGGVAILWNKTLASKIQTVNCDNDRMCAIKLALDNNQNLLIINAYLPIDNRSRTHASELYDQCINNIDCIIQQSNSDHVIVGGDLNVDLERNTANLACLLESASRNDLHFAWDHAHKPDEFTYTAPNMINGSRIDHFVLSPTAFNSIKSLYVEEIPEQHGHRPLVMNCELRLTNCGKSSAKYSPVRNISISWHKVGVHHIESYKEQIDSLIQNHSELHNNIATNCHDLQCENKDHLAAIDSMCDGITDLCINAGLTVFPKYRLKNNLSPYWKDNIKPYRDESLFWGKLWRDNGKPKTGVVHDIYVRVKREYHYAVRHHKTKVHELQKAKMAEAIAHSNHRRLWDELKRLRPKSNIKAPNIDGVYDDKDICKLFADKYHQLYNSVLPNHNGILNLKDMINKDLMNTQSKDIVVNVEMIQEAMNSLKLNKHDGNNELWSNHLVFAPKSIFCALSCLFTTMHTHGYTPRGLLLATIWSLVKNPNGNICSSNNYRGIALLSCISKLYDIVIIQQHSHCFSSSDLQFAYKKHHSTTMCTLAFKEIVHYYNMNFTNVYSSLLDASKAFDYVCFDKLFMELYRRNLPAPVMRVLPNMYESEMIKTSWQLILCAIQSFQWHKTDRSGKLVNVCCLL